MDFLGCAYNLDVIVYRKEGLDKMYNQIDRLRKRIDLSQFHQDKGYEISKEKGSSTLGLCN